jgi:succinoglycan biosynthesis transport protein ExoP
MELRDLLSLVWKRRWLLLAMVLISVAAAGVLAFSQPKRYEATATLALTPDVREGQGFVASDSISALLGTYAETAKAQVNLRRASELLGRPLPGEVDTSTQAGTGILRVTGKADSADAAAQTARAAAQAFSESIANNRLVVATLVDPAEPPAEPVQPRPPLIMGVTGILALLAGILLAFVVDQVRRRVETPEDVAELTDVPVIGRLPRQRSLQRGPARTVWSEDKMLGLQESFRALRTNVQFLTAGTHNVLQITSAEATQGKSTVAANLAIALGQVGIDTILVDADLRRPTQHNIFGLDNATGLSNLLALGGEPDLKPSGEPGLWILTSGPAPPDPTEMLHVRFGAVVEELRQSDALILIDTPPILPVSDARLIAPHTDGVLFVVAAGAAKPSTLTNAFERLRFANAKLLGVVLNQSGDEGDAAGGYYYQVEADDKKRLTAS